MRGRLRLATALAAVAFLLAAVAPRPAGSFELKVHEVIVRAALTGQMDAQALEWTIGDRTVLFDKLIPFGGGNVGSDLHQFAPKRHFDNARNGAEICARRNEGLERFMNLAVRLAAPNAIGRVTSREGALNAFGEATHSLADFYSHTNWLELAFEKGQTLAVAPLLDDTCDSPGGPGFDQIFPPELQSGYFDLAESVYTGSGLSGCPMQGYVDTSLDPPAFVPTGPPAPPPPFKYCHSELNKDLDVAGEGRGHVLAPDGRTYNAWAVTLATRATRVAWAELHQRVLDTYGTELGECLFKQLAFGGPACQPPFTPWLTPWLTPTETPTATSTATTTTDQPPTPTATPARIPTFTPTPMVTQTAILVDDAAAVDQTADMTVMPGQRFHLDWLVVNTGTTTWRAGGVEGYTVRFFGASTGQQTWASDVQPGATGVQSLDDVQYDPGVYRYFLQLQHNGGAYGPQMVIAVTVLAATPTPGPTATPPPTATPALVGAVDAVGSWRVGTDDGVVHLHFNAAGGAVTGTWTTSDGSGPVTGTFSGGTRGTVTGKWSGSVSGLGDASGTWSGTLGADGTGSGTFSGTIVFTRTQSAPISGTWSVHHA